MNRYLSALFLAVSLVSCVVEDQLVSDPESPVVDSIPGSDSFVSGEARVYLSEEMSSIVEEALSDGSLVTRSSSLNSVLESLGIREMYRLFPHAGEYEERTRREGLHRWYVVRYSEEVSQTKARDGFEGLDGVEEFEPVRQIKINDFNDLTSDLWGLNNSSYPGFDINVRKVWDEFTVGNPSVIVSVVDNGVDLNHEDLSSNCASSGHYNAVDGNAAIIAGDHGTHVAGTIAAVGNNGLGLVGVAGGDKAAGRSGVKIISNQIFRTNPDGSTSSGSSATAIKWGADHGAVISQNSWGYTYDTDGDGKLTGDELEKALAARISSSDKAAVDYFIKYAGCDNNGNQLSGSPMKGGVVIFAAGNDAITMGAPAEYEKVISVGSVASNGIRSSFSNYGDWVDICAPGTDIYSTLPGNRYGKMSGTSMACPHVSGVAALIVSHFGGPGFTADMLKEKLLGSANKSAISQAYQIGGLVDAYGAFVYGNDKAPGAVSGLKAEGRGNSIDLTLTVPSDDDGKAAYGFLVLYGTDRSKVETADADNYSEVSYRTFIASSKAGEQEVLILDGLEFEKEYHLKVLAYSYGRSYSPASDVLSASTTRNNPPVVTTSYEGSYTLMPSETLTIPVEAVEPDGHQMSVELVKGSDAETLTPTPDGQWRLTIKGNGAEMGTYTAKVVATDEYGLQGILEVEYLIRENRAPVAVGSPVDVFMKAKGEEVTLDLSQYLNDPDGEQLKYDAVLSNEKVIHANPKGNSLIITALSYGSTDVTVTGRDARGESAQIAFKVLVKDPSSPVSVYPNPVTDYVNVSTMDMADTGITITSQTGRTMYSGTVKASAFEPARIDMSSYAPGIYSMSVTLGGKEYTQTVVKL